MVNLAYSAEPSQKHNIFVFLLCEFLSCKSDGLNFLCYRKESFVKETISVTLARCELLTLNYVLSENDPSIF